MGMMLPISQTISNVNNNLNATRDPTADDDINSGYYVGSVWYNIETDESYTCVDNTEGAAEWVQKTVDNHSELSGLSNDDHTQYLLTSGSRGMKGNFNINGHNIEDNGTNIYDGNNGYIRTAILQNSEITITAGNGLSNGGSVKLGNSVTLDIASSGIGKNELDLSISPTWSSIHQFDSGIDARGDIVSDTITIWDNENQKLNTDLIDESTLKRKNVHISSDYTLDNDEYMITVDASDGNVTIDLPASPEDGELHNCKKTDSTDNSMVVSGNGKNIDGSGTINTNVQWETKTVYYSDSFGSWLVE